MSQLDDFQNNLKVAKRRYKKALKEYKEANERLSAIQNLKVTGRAFEAAMRRPRLHLSGQNQTLSQRRSRETFCSPPMLILLVMLTTWKYILS